MGSVSHPPKEKEIFLFAGFLDNHDRTHNHTTLSIKLQVTNIDRIPISSRVHTHTHK